MSRIILVGGGKLISKEFDWINNYISSKKKILIIPSFSKNDQKWFEIIKKKFNYLGTDKFVLFDFNEDINFEHFDVIITTGGYPDLLMNKLLHFKEKLQKWFIKKNNTYLGISSGALIVSNTIIITKDEDYKKSCILSGLNILPYSIEVHYSPEVDAELKSFNIDKILAILEKSGVVIENSTVIKFFGENYIFKQNKKYDCRELN